MGLQGGTDSCSRADRSAASDGGAKPASGISLGDRVVRGPSWSWYHDQDGGPGGYGTVIDVRGLGPGGVATATV